MSGFATSLCMLRSVIALGLAFCALAACAVPMVTPSSIDPEARTVHLSHPAMSPDGRLVAVHFDGHFRQKTRRSKVAIFDVEKGSYVLIPQDEGWNIADPVFSPDGRALAVVAACCGPLRRNDSKVETFELRLYDVRTAATRTIASGREIHRRPAFALSGKELIVSHTIWPERPSHLTSNRIEVPALVSIADGRRRDILPQSSGFAGIYPSHQDRDGSIHFLGSWPQDPELRAEHKEPYYDRWSLRAYRLGPDGVVAPSIFQAMAPNHRFSGLAADAGRKRTILSTWLQYKHHVFVVDGGEVRPVAFERPLQTTTVSVSANGKRAAVQFVGWEGSGWDVALLDVDAGTWTFPDWGKQLERDVVE